MESLQIKPHKRLNILTNEWVLVSPHRTKRPWQGSQEEIQQKDNISYDPNCYLCPGNQRASGDTNPMYENVYVFNNDFAALNLNHPKEELQNGLLKAQTEQGICRVICFSPDHSKSLSNMTIDEIDLVVNVWIAQYKELAGHPEIQYVQIFENKGAIMGCSNPHPHGQIWSQSSLPNEVIKRNKQQKIHFEKNNVSQISEYLNQEKILNERIVYENEHFVILVPFWAIWPYETMIIPKEHQPDITKMNSVQTKNFADAIATITKIYDTVFNCSFPYSSGIHQAPTDGNNNAHWHWHMTFYPPLLRGATVKKFMVGYEMFANPQRDITPEIVANQLKNILNHKS